MFAYLGSFTRYMADYFCQAAETNKFGFLQTQARWYVNWTGRFASNLSIAAAVSAGPAAAGDDRVGCVKRTHDGGSYHAPR